jgi:hypothetical protein
MPETGPLLELVMERVELRPFTLEGFHDRRDRKRRNQRISAGVVGIAVFVALALILGTVGLSDRTQGPAGGAETGPTTTGPAETGPAETGPAETGPTVTGPVSGNTGDPSSLGFGLPPEGATPSKPLRGELVMKDSGSDLGSWYAVNLYADGRLIWSRQISPGIVSRWIEQRLTPEGVELLRSGAVPLGGEFENPGEQLPVSAWEDPELRPYVPARYGVCFEKPHDENAPPSLADLLPAEAQELLRGAEHVVNTWGCRSLAVTPEDVRSLVEILSDAGFELIGDQREEQPVDGGPGGMMMVTDLKGLPDIELWTFLPDGATYSVGF